MMIRCPIPLSCPLQVAYQKSPVESDRDAWVSAPRADALSRAGPAAGATTRGALLVRQGPGWWSSGTHPVICGDAVPSRKSRVSRHRVEGRTRRWFRLMWGRLIP
jgi:hypothetical protein